MDFYKEFEERIIEVNKSLEKYIEEKECPQSTIYKAMNYSVKAGGKRIRPVFMIATAELMGGNGESVMPFACALEMIHTYSLIHDDLPCMDNDDLRRGKPTNHKVFGEAIAVLAGDALLNCAYETMLKNADVSPNMTLAAMTDIATAAGTEGMIGGQVIDIESEGKAIDAVTLMTMHLHKTAALIMTAARVGALLGGGSREDLTSMEEFARYLGIAFQIKDDILDITGDEETLGKKTGVDGILQKSTFVSIYGMEQSKNLLNDYTQKAIEVLSRYGEKAEFLIELSKFLLSREN